MSSIDFDDDAMSPLACPRCGYDLRGTVMEWEEHCPIAGTCSECGLEFMWGRVLCPGNYEPGWCVEYAATATAFARAVVSTALMSFVPWSFWKRLRMSDRIRWGRLVGYVVCLMLPLLLAYTAEQTALALRVRQLVEQDHAASVTFATGRLNTLRQMRARQTVPLLQQQFDKEIGVLQGYVQSPAIQNLTPAQAVMEAVFTPLSKRSRGNMAVDEWASTSYVPPQQLHTFLLNKGYSQGSATALPFVAAGGWPWLAAGSVAYIGIPIGLLLLPISRSLARVRWVHVLRITLYGVIVPALVLAVLFAMLAALYAMTSPHPALITAISLTSRWPLIVLVNAWWMFAIARYLRMPRGWLMAPVFSLLWVLLAAGVLYLVSPDLLIEYD